MKQAANPEVVRDLHSAAQLAHSPSRTQNRDRIPQVGDVVLFLFTDPNFKRLWIWKLGVVEEQVSRSTFKIRYSGPDGVRRHVERAAKQISIIVPANQLPLPTFISAFVEE